MSQTVERLRRLLFLVPFVSQHPGHTVEEVAAAVGCTRSELLEELDLLPLVGRPPFQPDDYLDIYVEDDRVYVELDQRLSTPPRLTAPEGAALAAAAALLKPTPGSTLAEALGKLERILPPSAQRRYREMAKQLDVASDGPESLATVSQAILERRELEFDYVSIGRGDRERRRVRAAELFNHRGQWYLQAYCLTRNGERLFRADRMVNLTLTDVSFEPLALSPRIAPGTNSTESRVRVRFAKELAGLQIERFGDAAQVQDDGSVVVTVPGDSEAWLTRWVLGFGGQAVVLEPASAVAAVARAARASLQSV